MEVELGRYQAKKKAAVFLKLSAGMDVVIK